MTNKEHEKIREHRDELIKKLTLIAENELLCAVSLAKDNPCWKSNASNLHGRWETGYPSWHNAKARDRPLLDEKYWHDVQEYGRQIIEISERIMALTWVLMIPVRLPRKEGDRYGMDTLYSTNEAADKVV